MVNMLISPRTYLAHKDWIYNIQGWFANLVEGILEKNLNIKIFISDTLTYTCINDFNGTEINMFSRDRHGNCYTNELLTDLYKEGIIRYIDFLDYSGTCSNLTLDPNIIAHITSRQTREFFFKMICVGFDKYKCSAFVDHNDDLAYVGKSCLCSDEYLLKNRTNIPILNDLNQFVSNYASLCSFSTNEISLNLSENLYSLRQQIEDMMKFWISCYFPYQYELNCEIADSFVIDVIKHVVESDEKKLIGSMARTILFPKYKRSDYPFVIECHPDSNIGSMRIRNQNFDIYRTYLQEDNQTFQSHGSERIITAKAEGDEKVYFICYEPEHDVAKQKIKKIIETIY